jgi:hypothetical protein
LSDRGTNSNEEIFHLIADEFASGLSSCDFKREKLEKSNKNIKEIFSGKNAKYEISYDPSESIFFLKSCNPDSQDDLTVLSKWLFDPMADREKQTRAITADFLESVGFSGSKGNIRKIPKNIGKKRRDENFNADPMFLINRLASLFPEIKPEIQKERESYEQFRFVNFTKKNINPKLESFLCETPEKNKLKKLSEIFNGLYKSGDLDTRAVITSVILNSIDDDKKESAIKEHLSDDLKKAWDATRSIRGKKISPEKSSRRYNYMLNSLRSQETTSP